MTLFELLYRLLRRVKIKVSSVVNLIITYIKLKGNGVKFKNIQTSGIPFIVVSRKGKFEIAKDFRINNGLIGNPIGRPQPCTFVIDNRVFKYQPSII